MRTIKTTVKCRVPSWNYCNYDGFTDNNRFSKELCRFCVKTKTGYRCLLFDQDLAADATFVHKPKCCIQVTAGFAAAEEPTSIAVDPKTIITEAIKQYKKLEQQLLAQGYPPNMAASLAEGYMKGDTSL